MPKLDLSLIDKFYNLSILTRTEAERFITKLLTEHNNVIALYNEKTHGYVGNEVVTVSYDGGNHPEYASNVFSNVHKVYFEKQNGILLDTEDSTRYPLDSCFTEDVINLALYLNKWQHLL